MSDNIKVVVKVRPLISREIDDKLGYQWRVNNNTLYQIDQNGKDCGQYYTFDKVYDKDTKTDDVYNDIAKPIVEAATAGFNGTIFAYGQTSSGKTYTMAGTKEAPGIIPLAVMNLFDIIKNIPDRDFLVRVSYVEIYNETLTDLLDLKKNIKIQETLQGVKVDATEKLTTSPEEVLDVMRVGKANRQTGATNMNEESSRSHSIFQITIESREHIEGEEEVGSVNVSQLNLVDLAGSERSGQTGATGIRFKEGTHINKSLSSLALVIKQLSEDPNKHVNYRDSKLTRILQNSLGGNAKTSIICAVTPAAVEETISTLQFANRAKAIKNNPAVNAVATNVTMIQTLTKQLSALKTQLESKKNVEQDNYNLQKQIGGLQRLILNGFAQRSSTDLGGARRKLHQPRRVTISTLHPIQEDPVPSIPKFCTPSLKYNPMSIASVSDFVPIHNVASLPSVSEELRLITPPPTERKVYFDNEIIELDSDDDNSTDIQTCSPYHKCYQSSKTPPCVLRKNAKLAEKNFKDIVELTEREKIYTPNIVELMEKLEIKSTTIAKLEDEIHKLSRLSNDKDLEMERLKCNINKMEDEIKNVTSAKADLEAACKNYNTKLTDWEVSYETLKKKAKTREDELLSLLQEHEAKQKYEKIGKLASKSIERELTNFMDLSRDISLVNSDNENSIINIEEGRTFEVQHSKNNIESKLSIKDQTILDLKSDLQSQKLKIDNLETINKELQEIISSYKEKLTSIENENILHKSTIDKLNNNIENQKTVLETMNTDIDSYNSVIQELQIKLAKKENVTGNIDVELEEMISKEEMFIANNENMKNIIQTLKAALNARNEEIKNLKSSLGKGNTQEMEELESKKKEISLLIQEVESLKTQSNKNIVIIDKLLEEKNNLLHIEQQLQIKYIEIQKEKELLDETIEQYKIEINELKICRDKSNIHLEEKEREILSIKEIKDKEIRTLSAKIIDLEENIKVKDEIVTSLQKHENDTEENLNRVQSYIHKINKIMVLFTGNILEVPEKINDLVSALSILCDHITSLESLASDTIAQKTSVVTLLEQKETELEIVQSHINDLSDAVECFYKEYENLTGIYHKNGTCSKDSNELQNIETNSIECLKSNIMNLIAVIKLTQISINETLHDKETEINDLNSKYESKEIELKKECSKVTKYMQEIEELTNKRDSLLQNILQKTTKLTSECTIENTVSCQFSSNLEHMYEQIILTLDKISNHISILNTEREAKYDNIESKLLEAKNEIKQLTEENIKLIQDISNLESSNKTLTSDIKRIQDDSKSLTIDLQKSNNLLNQMQQDLTRKCSEIEIVEANAIEWKGKFRDLEVLKKKQIKLLENENLELKSKLSGVQLQDRQDSITDSLRSNQQSLKKSNIYTDINSPPSLLKICCESIIDAFSTNEDDKTISSASSSTDELKNIPCVMKICQCKNDLDILKENNIELMATLKQLQNENEHLNKERQEVQKEVQLLVENINELQKKIVNHRTNLSTLTATTYAENRSLSSQVKFLQHHHNRFHIVCQRDIPDFKNQLQELLILLKSENLGKLNESLKRYSLPNALEAVALHSPLKNESMIDGDLLMLDTNITLTTCDNTLISHDQTCFDVTQVCTYNEVACQTNLTELSKCNLSYPQMKVQSLDETAILKTLESLKVENGKLRKVVDEYLQNKKSKNLVDAQHSPIKISVNCHDRINNSEDLESCKKCEHIIEKMKIQKDEYEKEIELITNKMTNLESQKVDIETKYQQLSLELPSSEILVRKLGTLEKDNCQKQNEIDKLNSTLDKKCEELKTLQEENDLLSNQIIESISEVDDLKKEHDSLKEINNNLSDKFSNLEKEIERLKCENKREKQTTCMECTVKNEIISTLKSNVTNSHQKLDRSYSDSDSSSRYNKICTLQNELHAGKEDCIELKEQVTTIKNHLERSNLSMGHAMDLDDSIGDSHICSFNEDFENIKANINKYNMPDIPEERPLDNYTIDKIDCFNYYIEKTAADKNTLNCDGKIIDVMKMLYENIENKHANEIENLNNKLKDFEESKNEIQIQLNKMNVEQTNIRKELKEKDTYFETLANVVSQIRNNIATIKSVDFEDIVTYFSDNVLMKVDKEFGFTSTDIFKFVIQEINEKQQTELTKLATENDQLNNTLKQNAKEFESLHENLSAMKLQLTEKENNLDLLQRQKEKIHEISSAVTLDIVKREKQLNDQVIKNYERLLESKIIKQKVDITLPTMEIIDLLFEDIFNNHEKLENEKHALFLKMDELKEILDVKEKELQKLNAKFIDFNKTYKDQQEERNTNIKIIEKLTEDISTLKTDISDKDALIASLKNKVEAVNNNIENEVIVKELLQSSASLQQEIDNLKSINDIILKEKKTYAEELEKASAVIKQNKIDFEILTSDILLLKETIKESSNVAENLKLESERLLKENTIIQNQFEEKCKEYSRMEENIKKHQKTTEIQSGIIIRLKKQKQEDETLCLEKNNQIEKLTQNCKLLETQSQELTKELQSSKEKIEELLMRKQLLEARISELETNFDTRPRLSIDALADSTRRRRQSIHDSKRIFSDDVEEHHKMEAVFKSCGKADDLFMDVDENTSNRSTPIRLSRGRDSLLPNHDQSERDDERPSSVQAARRRRQSAHDLRRAAHDTSRESSQNNSMDSDVIELRKQLSSCQQELEELKDKYRELDEECETCAEYLKERDEQCLRLKKEKLALEKTVAELKEKLTNSNPSDNTTNIKKKLVDASVKTDEDWVNLHSIVVDRMSYNMEVEKNKKLMKTVEELRFNKQDLKKTMAKMQKALEKNNVKDSKELEAMKAELSACKQELEELKVKYKELDDECETCAEYLRERDEQCRKLKEAKIALELKLQEYQDLSNITHSVRKKRQNHHDKNRTSSISLIDAATLTDDDLLRYHVEKNAPALRPSEETHAEMRRLKSALDKLSQQKAALEHQLLAASANPLYVATGSAIIQNQQLTDVMKENQKLKKINAKLVTICKKRGKAQTDANRENEDPMNN